VVADTTEQARDAAELIEVAYRPLPAVVDAAAALAAGAPLLWDEAPGNLSYRFGRGDKAAVDAAFAGAAHIVEIELVNNRLVVAPIEPRAAIGHYDAAGDRLELLLTGQGVHSLRQQLANAVFHIPPERIVVRAPDVGGGFGVKNFLYPEWVLVLWAARRLGRPVKWVAERGEEFVSSAQGRDNQTRGRLALDHNGRFLALDVDTVANLGAYLSTNGPGSSTNSPARAMGGVYAIPAVFMAVRGVFTNPKNADDPKRPRLLSPGLFVRVRLPVGVAHDAKLVAERARQAGVTKVVFDRGGFAYHGRIAGLADAAREAGLDF